MFRLLKKEDFVKSQFREKKPKNTQNGISLIELLVAAAILLVLLVALFRNLAGDRNKAEDAQRKKDLKVLQRSYEEYYNDHQYYPIEGILEYCGGDQLQPYLREIPCDPSGDPYLYIAYPGSGDTTQGYRILSKLGNKSDPVIDQLGCRLGCGLPEDSELDPSAYVYGVASGVALVDPDGLFGEEGDSDPTGTSTPTSSPSPTSSGDGSVDPSECQGRNCYCCAGAFSDCNIWNPGDNCNMGPYLSVGACYADTPCSDQY